ncbi:hypothetical protein Ami103574_01640 [Aminipila butyrica]|uniref:HTH luxR-type domain-containing protein n=1 Tax=Aminipila butyrica TaxID=433296 RepID=A0A858BT16_9FIRM|nr:LuxR C-terminal-related transcriptional regulator [Aminipila butyrica]QIB68090.1 hypothetical protein Ami103574_01640 [Aminipila butyrica]
MKLTELENYKNFKDLSIEELKNGYIKKEETGEYACIYCGESFEEGVIYPHGERLLTAEKAVSEHIWEEHGGAFHSLVNLDKQICGLSEIQKSMLYYLYEGNDNKDICDEMGISAATVRTHKFNLQKAKREAKILLALLETAEDETAGSQKRPLEIKKDIDQSNTSRFELNSLHPFFTQFKYK